ncbi:MAG TPA: hypothetical protein VFA67_15480 [Candidatus Sulfotelmatobacter sp.]|nr:hypothetical protein [Candidatus Sulfotelmatobacter sp.]
MNSAWRLSAAGKQLATQGAKREQDGEGNERSHGWIPSCWRIHFAGRQAAERQGGSRNQLSPVLAEVRPKPDPDLMSAKILHPGRQSKLFFREFPVTNNSQLFINLGWLETHL